MNKGLLSCGNYFFLTLLRFVLVETIVSSLKYVCGDGPSRKQTYISRRLLYSKISVCCD